MKMPVTLFWDSRLTYIYALLGGYVKADNKTLQQMLLDFIGYPNNRTYCLEVFEKLEAEAKIGNAKQARIEISEADTEWFKNMVAAYVELFQADLLFAPTGRSLTLYAQHESRMLKKLGNSTEAREVNGGQATNSKKILETTLAMAAKGLIEIESIVPADESCTNFIARIRRTNQNPNTGIEETAVAKIDGTQIFIGIRGEELLPLGSPLRYQGAIYNFMHYMQTHTNQLVSKLDIQELENCRSKEDMTELVRNARFNKQLKKIFFEGTTQNGVRFTPSRKLSGNELKSYKLLLDSIRK